MFLNGKVFHNSYRSVNIPNTFPENYINTTLAYMTEVSEYRQRIILFCARLLSLDTNKSRVNM